MARFDLPPLWLGVLLILTWLSPWMIYLGPLHLLGWICIIAGLVLTILAMREFRRARTSILPGAMPSALITSGVFRRTRNPIYLADVLFLLGAALVLGRLLGLFLVPIFAFLLDRRFIRGEEARLKDAFGPKYDGYARNTRRWI